jgi:hypothetical protein
MTVEREFIDMPARIARLPRDERGFPVPAFVEWIDGKPDFRVMSTKHFARAINQNRCWLCDGQLGRHKAFVTGPMCAVNRINSEPPSHYECAKFAARNCPFLTRPLAKRNERDMPEHGEQAGLPIDRNPGVVAIWITETYKPFKPHAGNAGWLIQLGAPSRVEFWAQGRPAKRVEVELSVSTGLPFLRDTAAKHDGPEGMQELERQVKVFERLLDQVFIDKGTGTMQ